jgi:hypothetical protein
VKTLTKVKLDEISDVVYVFLNFFTSMVVGLRFSISMQSFIISTILYEIFDTSMSEMISGIL